MADTTIVKEGLHFAEAPSVGPDGRLYLSDFYAHEVLALDTTTWESEVVATVPAQPSGLGWRPDGTMLIVSMNDRLLLGLRAGGELEEVADLGSVARGSANDMYVDGQGRAWVGDFGFEFYQLLAEDPEADPLFGPGANPPTASIAFVDLDGTVSQAAEGLKFPNGMVELSDGRLVIAETVGACLTSYSMTQDGRLTDREVFFDLTTAGPGGAALLPDGICVDAEDGIWVSDPTSGGAVRVLDGRVERRIATSQPCFAVGLVGDQLVACTAESSNPNIAGASRTGRLEVTSAPAPAPAARLSA
jgi:sugar lactone lactonase YvrE